MSDTSWLRPAFFFHFNQIRHRNEGNHQVANPGFLEILPRILKLDRRLQQDIHQRERMVRNDETEHPRVLFLPEPPDSVLGRKLRPRDGPDRFVSEGDQRIPESPEVLRPQIGQEVGVLGVSRDSVEIHGHAAADQILYPVSIQPLKERLVIHVPTIIPESDGARKSDGPWTVERRQKTEDRRQKKHRKPENQMEAGMASAHIIGSRLLGHVHVYVHVGRFSSVSCLLSSSHLTGSSISCTIHNSMENLRDVLARAFLVSGKSLSAVARECGIDKGNLSRFLRKKGRSPQVGLRKIDRLLKALRVEVAAPKYPPALGWLAEVDAQYPALRRRLADVDPHDLHMILTHIHRPVSQRRFLLRRTPSLGYSL